MKAIEFEEQNVIIAENQDEYQNLPAVKIDDKYKTMITCMGLSIKERIKLLFTGKIWVSELTFGKAITPRYMSVNKKEVI